MNITKVLAYSSESVPKGKILFVFQSDDDWYWLRKLVQEEGFSTPFSTIHEIEAYLDMKLDLIKEEYGTWEINPYSSNSQ